MGGRRFIDVILILSIVIVAPIVFRNRHLRPNDYKFYFIQTLLQTFINEFHIPGLLGHFD